jgi:hypothetical protein
VKKRLRSLIEEKMGIVLKELLKKSNPFKTAMGDKTTGGEAVKRASDFEQQVI